MDHTNNPPSKHSPQFSIIIPCFNDEDFASEAIRSCLSQTYQDFEIVFVDDGSEKDACNHIKNHIKNNANLKLIRKNNGGLSSARNTGIKAANGRFLLFLDSDDLIEKDFLFAANQIIQDKYQDDILIVMPFAYFKDPLCNDKDLTAQINFIPPKLISRFPLINQLMLSDRNCFPVSSCIISSRISSKIGMFDESLPSLEDWDYWLRAAKENPIIIYAPDHQLCKTLIRVRDGMTSDKKTMSRAKTTLIENGRHKTMSFLKTHWLAGMLAHQAISLLSIIQGKIFQHKMNYTRPDRSA